MYSSTHIDPRGGHNRASINHQFFKKWSPAMAYILGFIFADGAIEDVQKSSRTCYLSITNKDLEILEQIRAAMNSDHRFYKRAKQYLIFPGGKRYFSEERFVFRIGSKVMYNDLLGLGVTPKKSLIISFPLIPNEFLSFFIRGYFDGDGCIYLIKDKYPRLIFTSGSKLFLEGLSESISNFLQIPIKKLYVQIPENQNPCYRLHYNTKYSRSILEFMYKDLEQAPYLDRKYTIYQKYLKISK